MDQRHDASAPAWASVPRFQPRRPDSRPMRTSEFVALHLDSPMTAESCQAEPMRRIDRLGTAQRVVVVVALGLGLGIAASYLTSLGTGTGWYAYAPLSGQSLQPQGIVLASIRSTSVGDQWLTKSARQ